MSKRIRRNKRKKIKGGTQHSPKAKDITPQGVSLLLDQVFQLALQNFQAGKLQEAEQLCHQLLNENPDNAAANHFLGIITAEQGGEIDRVIGYIEKAIHTEPTNAEYHKNLGLILKNSGKMDEAIASFRNGLLIKPDYAEAYKELIGIYKSTGRPDDAINCIKEILSLNPDIAELHNNLGLLLKNTERLDDAVVCFRQVLTLAPDNVDALLNLGLIFKDTGRFEESFSSFQKALGINPNSVEAQMNFGLMLKDVDRMEEAAACFRNVLVLNPENVKAHNNLGLALQELGRRDEAVACFKNALKINPHYVHAHHNLGFVYNNLCMLDKAITSLRKALQLKDDYFVAHSSLLFIMNYQPHITQQEIFEDSLNFSRKQVTTEVRYSHLPAERYALDRKLRIGYISPDFCKHSVSFFIKPLLEAHNRKKIEVYCYSDVESPDNVTGEIKALADHWAPIVKKGDEEVITQITEDGIDILVDLAGHTKNNRIPMFAHKPAPIQVSWLGYPNTTGLQAMDYRFTDRIADPIGRDDEYYSEELIRLKDCFLCYQPYESSPETISPPSLKSKTVTFGSFNNAAKINSEVIKVWSKILLGVPGSKLVLKAKQLESEHVVKNFIAMFAKEGIASDRLELLSMIPDKFGHLALYNEIDIALDPFPYNGTTTTCEALWMGVPIVSLLGDRHAGRVGASILHAIGMEETLVAESSETYIELAINLAEDKELLTNLRKVLRQQMKTSPLCNAKSFAKKIEDAYQEMWEGLLRIN